MTPASPAGLRVGERAPQVDLTDSGGGPLRLPGATPTLIVFLPWAFSPVCTTEVAQLREVAHPLAAAGVRLVGVTCDAVASLAAWGEAEAVGFALASDFWPHGAAATAYGVLEEATGAPRRVSFLVDAVGVVRWTAAAPPGRGRDVDAHLAAARELGVAA